MSCVTRVGPSPRAARAALALLAALLVSVGCTDAENVSERDRTRSDAVVVASFDFPESDLVAEIYAQALTAAGVPVRREAELGSRELVLPALQQGLVDVVPEYLGTALASVSPDDHADRHDPAATRRALDAALHKWGLRTLTPAFAANQNALVVTGKTARRFGFRNVSDLRGLAPLLTFGATPECEIREYCLAGLTRVYGLHFRSVVPIDSEAHRVAALREGVVDVALLFTTDGSLATEDLVMLHDDRRLQPVENLVPVVSDVAVARYGDQLTATLDRVSARLTTGNLRFLNWRLEAGEDVAAEARGWLLRHGLLTPPA